MNAGAGGWQWWRRPANQPPSRTALILNGILLFLLVTGGAAFFFSRLDYTWNWPAIWAYRQKFVEGWWATIWLSLASLMVSLLIGIILMALQRSRWVILQLLGRTYVELIRGTPLLVQVLIFFYIIADGLGLQNRWVAGILILSIFSGAYVGEILRGGVDSVAASQLDAARAVGFDDRQTWRFVILPQALRQTLPALTGQFVSLVKDSSLLSVIAIREFTMNAREANNFTYSTFEALLPLAIGYLVLTFPMSMLSRWLEARFRYET